jgi:hypothetical protein
VTPHYRPSSILFAHIDKAIAVGIRPRFVPTKAERRLVDDLLWHCDPTTLPPISSSLWGNFESILEWFKDYYYYNRFAVELFTAETKEVSGHGRI